MRGPMRAVLRHRREHVDDTHDFHTRTRYRDLHRMVELAKRNIANAHVPSRSSGGSE